MPPAPPLIRRTRRPRRLDCPLTGQRCELVEVLADGYSRIRTTNQGITFETRSDRLHLPQ